MTKYLISFPASAMNVPSEELAAVDQAARSVIREAKAAGVYVFGGGLDAGIPPVRVGPDGRDGTPAERLVREERNAR